MLRALATLLFRLRRCVQRPLVSLSFWNRLGYLWPEMTDQLAEGVSGPQLYCIFRFYHRILKPGPITIGTCLEARAFWAKPCCCFTLGGITSYSSSAFSADFNVT